METQGLVNAQSGVVACDDRLRRHISPVSMFGMAFSILNSWCVLSASLNLTLTSGGPSVVLWGLLFAGSCNVCLAMSMAEFLTTYPTAGGQYHWVAMLAPKTYARELAWLAGWISCFGWIAVAASGSLLTSQLFLSELRGVMHHFTVTRQTDFATYMVVTLVASATNLWFNGILDRLSRLALFWSFAGILLTPVVLIIWTDNTPKPWFALTYFVNRTRWPDAVASVLGLLQAGLALNGFDAVAHMIEEVPEPSIAGPKIMVLCVALGTVTGFVFELVLLSLSGDPDTIEQVINSSSELDILLVITKSPALVSALAVFPLLSLLLGTIGIIATSSRMIFAFARDRGLPFSKQLASVDEETGTPSNALYLSGGVTAFLGFTFLVSDTAFSAIASASVSALSLSYAMPVIINCLKGRPGRMLIGRVSLPRPLGWLVNLGGASYSLVTSVLFLAPPKKPGSARDVNYGLVVFLLVLLCCALTWFRFGRANYVGPTIGRYNRIITEEEQNRD